MAAINSPNTGGSIGIASQNNRGFIDVTIGLAAGNMADRLTPASDKINLGAPWREDVADLLEDQLRLVINKQQIRHLRGPESAHVIVGIMVALSSKADG